MAAPVFAILAEMKMMLQYRAFALREHPERKHAAAEWFHSKWGLLEAYFDSMHPCIENTCAVPQWYIVKNDGEIVGGLGVIANNFHARKDLTPNVCAVYVEEKYRCQGIAGEMLHYVCMDMQRKGISTLYLITDHKSFYERYGWKFSCMVQGDGEAEPSRMHVHTTL